MKKTINEFEFVMRTNWEEFEYPPILNKNSLALVLFRATILFRRAIEEMSNNLLTCDDGVYQAIEDYSKYFDILEKQVIQTRRILANEGYSEKEYETLNS